MEIETHILSNLGAAPDLSYAIAAELRGTSEKVRCKKHEMPASIKFRNCLHRCGHFSPQNPQKVLRIQQNTWKSLILYGMSDNISPCLVEVW